MRNDVGYFEKNACIAAREITLLTAPCLCPAARGSTHGASRSKASPRPDAVVAAADIPHAGRPRGARGSKRTAEDLEVLSSQVVSFVRAKPGLRIEQINKQLGTTTKDVQLPIRKLVSEGVLAAKGQRRATTYFLGKKASKG